MSFFRKIRKIRASKVPAGLYAYRGKGKFTGMALQLRVEPDGTGLLVINANTDYISMRQPRLTPTSS